MKNPTLILSLFVGLAAGGAHAADLNNAGNITATSSSYVRATTDVKADQHVIAQGDVRSMGGYVRAQTYFYTPGYVSASGSITAGTNISAGATLYATYVDIGLGTPTGIYSAAIGAEVTASSYSSLVLGRYNVNAAVDGTATTGGTWVAKDPLLLLGNGTGTVGDANEYRNAFAVYKDGTVTMSKAQGDIQMGQFGN